MTPLGGLPKGSLGKREHAYRDAPARLGRIAKDYLKGVREPMGNDTMVISELLEDRFKDAMAGLVAPVG